MNRREAQDRIEKLRDCLAWSLQNNRLLTDSQRICLNQERAAWHVALNEDELNPGEIRVPSYKVPPALESRIQQISSLIRTSKWNRKRYENQFKAY